MKLLLLSTIFLAGCSAQNFSFDKGISYQEGAFFCKNNICCIAKNNITFCSVNSTSEVFIYIKVIEQ